MHRCPYFQCNDGYYLSTGNQALVSDQCSWTEGVLLSPNCGVFMHFACEQVRQCEAGVSTYSTWINTASMTGGYLLDANNNRQCTPCQPCFPGSVQYTDCTTSSQRVCGLCQDPLYQYGAQCVGATPNGYRPYVLTVGATITNNSLAFPSHTLAGSTFTIFSPWPPTIGARAMLPCPALGVDRQFKAWSPSVGALTCTSPHECLNLTGSCDLLASSECKGYVNGTVGWYTGTDGLCVACTSSSPEPECGWGMGGQVSTCTRTTNTQCVACNGTKPGNSAWTKPISPFFFASTPQCEWECNVGYYRLNGACTSCFVPANGIATAGDSRAGNPVNLNSTTFKFFGGTVAYGCKIKCNPGYYFVDAFIGQLYDPSKVECKQCQMPTCTLGNFAQADSNNCFFCQPCAPVSHSAILAAGSCAFQCNTGYFLQGQACVGCSVPTCSVSQYMQACASTRDAYCTSCSGACGAGQTQTRACNATSDRACALCNVSSVANGAVGPECVVSCNTGFALDSVAKTCTACKTHDYDCAADAEFVACDLQYLGCKACAVPSTVTPWCWTGYPAGKCQTTAYPSLSCALVPPQFLPARTGATVNPISSSSSSSPKPVTTTTTTTTPRPTTTTASRTTTTTAPRPTTPPPTTITSSTAPTTTTTTAPTSTSTSASTTTENLETTTENLETTTPIEMIDTTPPPAPQYTVASVTMDNVTIETVTCEADVISAALSDAYGCDVDIMGFITMMGTIDCPDFVCPCDARRRRGISSGRMMLSTPSDPTSVEIIYQFSQPPQSEPADPLVVTRNLESALGATAHSVTTLSTKASAEWVTVKSLISASVAAALDSSLLPIIIGGVVGGAVLLLGGGVLLLLACEYGWFGHQGKPVYTRVPMAMPAVEVVVGGSKRSS